MYCIFIGCLVTALLANAREYRYSTRVSNLPQQQQQRHKQPKLTRHVLADPAITDSYVNSYKETVGELNYGRHYFEGDIILTKQQSDFITRSQTANDDLHARAIVKGVKKLWPDRVVPYALGDDLSDETKGYIESAVQEWKNKTCLNIRPKTEDDEDYIEFVYDGGCSSYVGKIGGKQTISVGAADGSVTCRHGNIVHEIAHTLGYFHEHSRPDRDEYININWDNVMDGYEQNFRKETVQTIDSRGVPYDYDSVMHYGAFFFTSNDEEKTIETVQDGASIGQRVGLSVLDRQQARLLYNCDGDFDDNHSNTQYHDTSKRHDVKKDEHKKQPSTEQSSMIKNSSTEKKSKQRGDHLKNAVKHYVNKIRRKTVKTKTNSIKKNNMEGTSGYESNPSLNTQQALQSQNTQQPTGSENGQQALQSQNTQETTGSENTHQVTASVISQSSLQPVNSQQATGSETNQQADGTGAKEDGKPKLIFEDDDLGEENLGMNFFEGDMILTDDQRQHLENLKDDNNEAVKRALIKNTTFLWPERTVYYKFDKSVDEIGQENAENAIKHWQDKTCLKFKKRENEKDYINFVFEGGCASRVGRGGGMQKLTIGSTELRCKKGNIIHELGHALGFFHEHSRPDRDEYVKVMSKNILPGYERNFYKFSTKFIDSRNVPYDYGSIMQYGRAFFSKLALLLPTMVTTRKTADGEQVKIGQRVALSPMDIMQANLLYGCDGHKRLTDEERQEIELEYSDPMTGPCGDLYDFQACSTIKSLGYCNRYPRTLRNACGQTCQLCSLHHDKKSLISRLRLDEPYEGSHS